MKVKDLIPVDLVLQSVLGNKNEKKVKKTRSKNRRLAEKDKKKKKMRKMVTKSQRINRRR